MIYMPRDVTNDEVFDIVRAWVDIFAMGNYEAAFTAIISDAESETWTPHFLKIAIEGYQSPEFYPDTENFQVTDWRTAKGGNAEARQAVTWYQPNSSGLAGSVEFDLPLNRLWSDLLAEFDIWENNNLPEGYLLGLDEIGSWEQRQRDYEAEEQSTKEQFMTTNFQFGVSEFTTNPWPFERDVETYARLGVSAIEVCEAKLDPAKIAAQMDSIQAAGLEITSVQPKTRTLFPSLSQPEPADISERMGLFRKTIETLSPWTPGVAYVTNTGIPPNGNMQEVIDRAATEYRELAEFAAGFGVKIALEPLNASIANIESAIWTLPQAMEVVRAVDRDNFGICLDSWNVWQNADIHAEIEACGAKIFVVQISDWRTPRSFLDRLVPGQGAIPLPAFLKSVHAAGFQGAYSVEIFSSGVPQALWDGDLEKVITDSKAGMDAAWVASGIDG